MPKKYPTFLSKNLHGPAVTKKKKKVSKKKSKGKSSRHKSHGKKKSKSKRVNSPSRFHSPGYSESETDVSVYSE